MARTIAKDHDEKRINILTTSARIFADQGIARTSMSRIARECGISKASIYHYYDSKDALLFDILDTYLSSLRDRLRDLPLEALPPADRLRHFMSEVLLAYRGMDNVHKIQIDGVSSLNPERQEVLKGYQRDMVTQLSGIILEIAPAAFAGERRKLRAATMSVFGMLNWFYTWNGSADRTQRDEYVELAADITLRGVRGL